LTRLAMMAGISEKFAGTYSTPCPTRGQSGPGQEGAGVFDQPLELAGHRWTGTHRVHLVNGQPAALLGGGGGHDRVE
jgi:hypothetical protein